QRVEPREGVRAVAQALEQGGQPHLLEGVEAVVARCAVGTDADRQAGAPQGDEVGDPGAQLQVRARTVPGAGAPRGPAWPGGGGGAETHTPWASRRSVASSPVSSKYSISSRPPCVARTAADSSRCSKAWVCTGQPRARESSRMPRQSGSEQVRMKRGLSR